MKLKTGAKGEILDEVYFGQKLEILLIVSLIITKIGQEINTIILVFFV